MVSARRQILSISSMKTMPFCSALESAARAQLLLVEHPGGFLVRERLQRIAHAGACAVRAPAAHVLEHLLELLRHLLHAGRSHDVDADRNGAQLDLDLALVELSLAQHLAELLARVSSPSR